MLFCVYLSSLCCEFFQNKSCPKLFFKHLNIDFLSYVIFSSTIGTLQRCSLTLINASVTNYGLVVKVTLWFTSFDPQLSLSTSHSKIQRERERKKKRKIECECQWKERYKNRNGKRDVDRPRDRYRKRKRQTE
jgi:hypothetical protein